jgi:DNA processing protein
MSAGLPVTPAVERAAMVALLRASVPGRWRAVADAVLERGSALALLREPDDQPALFDDSQARLATAAVELAAWESAGIDVHSILDESYPPALRGLRDRPPLLFSLGRTAPDVAAIAVIGTRAPTDADREMARRVSAGLVRLGVAVVSGFAAGIDTEAHEAALRAGGRTVAVLGTGVDRCYPAQNRALYRRIADRGLLLSQFWPGSAPRREHFPLRNAVTSGYCAATIVVAAGAHSGARIQARLALAQRRQLILGPGLLGLQWARDLAGHPGVHLAVDVAGILGLAEQVLAEQVLAEPVLAEPVLAEQVLAEPVLAEWVLAEQVLAGPGSAGQIPVEPAQAVVGSGDRGVCGGPSEAVI